MSLAPLGANVEKEFQKKVSLMASEKFLIAVVQDG